MAQTWVSRQKRHQRDMERRLNEEHRQLARAVAGVMIRFAGPGGILPNLRRTRTALSEAIWSQVLKPYYIGGGDNPFRDTQPVSPYARTLYAGVAGAVRIQVERQAAILNRVVSDEVVVQWLTGPRPPTVITEQRGVYDPFHLFVDLNGYRLSDRVWQTSINVRANIDGLLDYHISQGTSAVRIADLLEDYLTPGARLIRTRTPYGREGAYAARRLARTEITAAAGRGTVNAAMANPFVNGVQWRLSASHREPDQCDINAHGGPNGDGIYPPDQVPRYPDHPNELCTLAPVPIGSTADLVEQLRADIRANSPRAQILRGTMNPNWLTGAILVGTLIGVIEALHSLQGRRDREVEEQ